MPVLGFLVLSVLELGRSTRHTDAACHFRMLPAVEVVGIKGEATCRSNAEAVQ